MNNLPFFIKKYFVEIILVIFALLFSFWLMFHTFSYADGHMLISSKVWSDFASHIPLIRSFSFGDNFPPEYPLFPGEPIRYHFLFYALVGLLEKIGLRIDYALNIPSALSFAALILIIYLFAKTLFKSWAVGILSIIFFLFNGSLSFLEFFKLHPLSFNTLNDIITNSTFPSFGPYDGKIVSAFWNLNIYTNQRHLALPIAFLLTIIFFLLRHEEKEGNPPKYSILIFGILLGVLLFSHTSVFVMAFVVCSMLFFFFKKQRKKLFLILLIGIMLSLPRILVLRETATFIPQINPNYLIQNGLDFPNFVSYWFLNFGIAVLILPLGLALSSKFQRKVFLAFVPLFLIGHLIQLSPEVAGNHKFFNVFLIVGNMFIAYFLVRLWNWRMLSKIIVPILVLLLTLSGIIDFFPIKNDSKIALSDYPKNKDVAWIIKNTPKDSVFLNSTYLYHPASIAGRKIFLGWPYFAWSQGYDTLTRDTLRKKLFNPGVLNYFCKEAIRYNIGYISIERVTNDIDFEINTDFFERNFKKAYESKSNESKVYSIKPPC